MAELLIILFNANLYGTVSDWVIVMLTAVTAYLLINTLRSQRDVQKLQQVITYIEVEKHINAEMPNFEPKLSGNSIAEVDGMKIQILMSLNLRLNSVTPIYDIEYHFAFYQQGWQILGGSAKDKQLQPNSFKVVQLQFDGKEASPLDHTFAGFDLTISYRDLRGIFFKQNISYTFGVNGEDLSAPAPKVFKISG